MGNTVSIKQRSTADMLSLIRPLNCFITFASIAAMGLIAEMSTERIPALFFAATSGFFTTAFGNILNDIIDVRIDKINKPERPLPSGTISLGKARLAAGTTLFIGLSTSIYLGIEGFTFVLSVSFLLTVYNFYLKRILLAGNLAISVLTGSAFLFGGLAAGDIFAGLYPALFAFQINFIREILKDTEDIKGDKALGVITFPQVFGFFTTQVFISILVVVLIISTFFPYLDGTYSLYYLIGIIGGVNLPLFYVGVQLWKNVFVQKTAKLCIFLKYIMLLGLVAIMAGNI